MQIYFKFLESCKKNFCKLLTKLSTFCEIVNLLKFLSIHKEIGKFFENNLQSLKSVLSLNHTKTKNKMENKTLEQIQNEVLELTEKMSQVFFACQDLLNSVKSEVRKQNESPKIEFYKFMDLVDSYFEQKNNLYEIASAMERHLDLDDYCDVTLSLRYGNEIEIEKEWTDTHDIVENAMNRTHEDLKNWLKEECKNLSEEEDNTNEHGDSLIGSCATCGQDTEHTNIDGNCINCK